MENLMFSLNATIPIFLIMVIGYILKNLKVMDETFVKNLNSFNYKITLPVLLFKDISESDLMWYYRLLALLISELIYRDLLYRKTVQCLYL